MLLGTGALLGHGVASRNPKARSLRVLAEPGPTLVGGLTVAAVLVTVARLTG